MFHQFGATSETLGKATSVMLRIGTDAHLYDDPEDVNILPLLDSRFDSEKCEALKRLLALVAQGNDVSGFFPQVVKNVASPSFEVKKLVYSYLLHYAEKRPNEALLSINCFQKDLNDLNPLVRAWALRAMAGIRLHIISPLVLLAVAKCARDPSAYVRKCAASALPKVHDLHQDENTAEIEEIIGILLNDQSPGVVGAAAAAFACICPNNLSLIGRNFQRLCETLPDVEEWGQIALIGIILRYVVAKDGLVKNSIMYTCCGDHSHSEREFPNGNLDSGNEPGYVKSEICNLELLTMVSRCYIEGPDEYLSRSHIIHNDTSVLKHDIFTSAEDNDVNILLQSTSPLLWSHNSAVVLAAVGVHWIMAPMEDIKKIVKPLLFLLRSSKASKYVVLCNIQVFVKAMPSLFASCFEDFFVSFSDPFEIKALKLEILSYVATKSSISFIFQEFEEYIRDPDRRFAAATVAVISFCLQRLPHMTTKCLEGLLDLIKLESLTKGYTQDEACVLIQATTAIKTIIKSDLISNEKIIVQLVQILDSVKVPAARAIIIWMVGEYNCVGELIPNMLNHFLLYVAHCFISETHESKLQILNTSVKIFLGQKADYLTSKKALDYVIELAKCDLNYDIRDRACFMERLIAVYSNSPNEGRDKNHLQPDKDSYLLLAEHILMKRTKHESSDLRKFRVYLPGSLSLIVFHSAPGYQPLPVGLNAAKMLEVSQNEMGVCRYSVDGSPNDKSSTVYSSDRSFESSSDNSDSDETGSIDSTDKNDAACDSLINLDDMVPSNSALESWLDEQHPGLVNSTTSMCCHDQIPLKRIYIEDVSCSRLDSKIHTLLNDTIGNGLNVYYSFSSEHLSSPQFVLVDIFFENRSNESISELYLTNEESADVIPFTRHTTIREMSMVPMEEITVLGPGETTKRTLQVHFHHHILPIRLVLWCTGKRQNVKLRPDIGFLVKPFPMDVLFFIETESRLPGMFESIRRCNFSEQQGEGGCTHFLRCRSLAVKIVSGTNLELVSAEVPSNGGSPPSGMRLRFGGRVLSNEMPCLVTFTVVEGGGGEPLGVSVKVNCGDTVFGLNFLNGMVRLLENKADESS